MIQGNYNSYRLQIFQPYPMKTSPILTGLDAAAMLVTKVNSMSMMAPAPAQLQKKKQVSIKTQNQQKSPISIKVDREGQNKHIFSDYRFINFTLMNNELYLLGKGNVTHNDTCQIVKFNLATKAHALLETTGDKPTFRSFPLMQTLSNMYVTVYGGVDPDSGKVLDDGYLLILGEWKKLKINNQIEPRSRFSSTVCNGKIYLHGGEITEEGQSKYFQDLYVVNLSDTSFELSFELLKPQNELHPCARSRHIMTFIKNRYLIMFGGQGEQISNEDKVNKILLKDFWLFDLHHHQWQEVTTNLQTYSYRQLYSISIIQNEMYIFGGFHLPDDKDTDILRLSFPSCEQIKKEQKSHVLKPQLPCRGEKIQIATSMIHSVAYSIKFPFQAFQKIIEHVEARYSSTFVKIYSQITSNTLDRYLNVSIDFDFQQGGMYEQKGNRLRMQNQKLFCYCLRLGKTVFIVENNRKSGQRRVSLVSADGRFSALVDRMQISYNYTQNIMQKRSLTLQQQRTKSIILRILQTLISNPEQRINNIRDSKIMIFSPNIIPTPKTYYYEVVFDSLQDISIFKNNKKIDLLEKLRYDLTNSMQYSLYNYLKYSWVNCNQENKYSMMRLYLSNFVQPVVLNLSYAQYLRQFESLNKLTRLNLSNVAYCDFVQLYACHDDYLLPENNGILLYRSNRLVNRYECQFGNLLTEKFYQKKFSKNTRNLFPIVGEIHVSQQLKLVNFDTEFQQSSKYLTFVTDLEKVIQTSLQKISGELQIFKQKPKDHAKVNDLQKIQDDHQELMIVQQLDAIFEKDKQSELKKVNSYDGSSQNEDECSKQNGKKIKI